MANRSPADVIDAYRRHQKRRFPFTFADVSKVLLFIFILASSIYISFRGRPELPLLVDLKTNTPTFTPSITPTASPTATITPTPTETPDPENQCNCPSPIVLVVTATSGVTNTPLVLSTTTSTSLPTSTLPPSNTPIPTETLTSTPTPFLYSVQRSDTLSGIALRFGVSVEAIQVLNNLNTTMIYVGQVLQIPN